MRENPHTPSEGNRIARMTYNGSSLSGYTTIVTGIAKNRYHNGGRLAFGPDGYGYRNPQGIAWGWPTCEGTCSVSGMENPKRQWSVDVASPSGIAIVRDVVYMAALRGERLWRIPILSGESTGTPSAYYVGTYVVSGPSPKCPESISSD